MLHNVVEQCWQQKMFFSLVFQSPQQFVHFCSVDMNVVKCLHAIFSRCYSRIGRSYNRPGPQILSIGQYCDYEDIIIHEMLHAVGRK